MGVYRRKREEQDDPDLLQYLATSKARGAKRTDLDSKDNVEFDSSLYEPPPDTHVDVPYQGLGVDEHNVFPPGYGPVPGETHMAKLWRKCKQNPLVPLGSCVVLGSFGYGIHCMRTGKHEMSNKMMRLRILSSALTIAAIVAGGYYESYKIKKYREEWKQSNVPNTIS